MLKQELQQKLQQKLSPQQIQLMKLVQLPTVAFEQRVKEEMEENPALDDQVNSNEDDLYDNKDELYDDTYEDDTRDSIDEVDINVDEYLSDDEYPTYKTYSNNYSSDDEEKKVPYAQGATFYDHLKQQLHTFRLNQEDTNLADFIIGNLDEDGYLRIPVLGPTTWLNENIFYLEASTDINNAGFVVLCCRPGLYVAQGAFLTPWKGIHFCGQSFFF